MSGSPHPNLTPKAADALQTLKTALEEQKTFKKTGVHGFNTQPQSTPPPPRTATTADNDTTSVEGSILDNVDNVLQYTNSSAPAYMYILNPNTVQTSAQAVKASQSISTTLENNEQQISFFNMVQQIPNLDIPEADKPLTPAQLIKKVTNTLEHQFKNAAKKDSNTKQYLEDHNPHILGKAVQTLANGDPVFTLFYLNEKAEVKSIYCRPHVDEKTNKLKIAYTNLPTLRKILSQIEEPMPQKSVNSDKIIGLKQAELALANPKKINLNNISPEAEDAFREVLNNIVQKLEASKTENSELIELKNFCKMTNNSSTPLTYYVDKFQNIEKYPDIQTLLVTQGAHQQLLINLRKTYAAAIEARVTGAENTNLKSLETNLHEIANNPTSGMVIGHTTAKFNLAKFGETMAKSLQSIAERYQHISTLENTGKPAFRINAHEERWFRKGYSDISLPLVFNGVSPDPKNPAEIRIRTTSTKTGEILQFSFEGKLPNNQIIPHTDKMNLVAEAQALSIINHFKNGGTVADIRNLKFSPPADMYARIQFALEVQLKTLQLAGDSKEANMVATQLNNLKIENTISPAERTSGKNLLAAMHKDPVNVAFFAQQPKPVEKQTVPPPATLPGDRAQQTTNKGLAHTTPTSEMEIQAKMPRNH